MEKFTQDFIYALKARTKVDPYDAAVEFLAKACECPAEDYTVFVMYKIVKQKFTDFMRTCDHPTAILYDFFETKERAINCYYDFINNKKKFSSEDVIRIETNAMLFALLNTQVKEKNNDTGEYYCINGFTDN